jgi:uncharacterized protein (TIGR02466 family)
MDLLGLFPTGVGRVRLAAPTDAERAELDALGDVQTPNAGNTTSKNRLILQSPALAGLRAAIQAELEAYVKAVVCPASEPQIVITQSWLNYSKPGQWHHKHAHPGSWLSACYYVQADETQDKIYFHRDGYERIPFPPTEFNPFNSESWWLPVHTGDLVIFPSWLTHNVEPVQGERTRISLSLNTWFNGTAGSSDTLTELSCKVAAPFA